MKKVISLVLVAVMMLGCIGLVACGGGEEVGPPPTEEEEAPPSGVGLTWGDMPVYPGANQVTQATWSIPLAEGDYSVMEWRYYETGDSVSTVISFYKSEMPGNGWQQPFWMESPEGSWSYYTKNNERDMAMVWIASEEGKTLIGLMRAIE